MPEGPEVRVVRDYLSEILRNKVIITICISEKGKFRKGVSGSELFTGYSPVVQVDTIGKHIIIELKSRHQNIFVVNHLGMEGYWYYITHSSELKPHTHLYMEICNINNKTSTGYLCFGDTRHFSNFGIYSELDRLYKDIGPDLLKTALYDRSQITDLGYGKYVHWEDFNNALNRPRLQNKTICTFLMEQNRFSGIGNYIRAEVLYQCRINPFATLKSLNLKLRRTLLENILEYMYQSYKCQGKSFRTFQVPELIEHTGYSREVAFKVYGQVRDPLGHSVIKEPDGPSKSARTIHWVPEIQILGSTKIL